MTEARLAAARVLLALARHPTTLATELERVRSGTRDERDRGLLLELATGVLRWQAELDALIQACSNRPIGSLTADVRVVLRLGAYQVRHLDRIPAHAIVNESVELVRVLGEPHAAGFVNAVLRSLVRRGSTLALPARPGASASRPDHLAYLATALSHPEWLVSRWLDRYGFDATADWCAFDNQVPEICVRVLPPATVADTIEAIRAAGLDASAARWVRGAIRLAPGAWPAVPEALRRQLVVQDEGSQIVAHVAGARPGEHVLDVCAAPGGKTAILAAALEGRGQVVACDHRPARVRLLSSSLARAGVRSVSIVRLDATHALPFAPVFDRVLLDAPCSGLGTLRRDPDIKWSLAEADLARLARTQLAMLISAAQVVRPGGTLVYATCSSEPEENEDVVRAFLAADRAFAPGRVMPVPAVPDADKWCDGEGWLRTLPHRDALDAYFTAVLVRDRSA